MRCSCKGDLVGSKKVVLGDNAEGLLAQTMKTVFGRVTILIVMNEEERPSQKTAKQGAMRAERLV